jgi:hypothetical protein
MHAKIYVSSYHYICVLALRHMCPHTTTCVLIILQVQDSLTAQTGCSRCCPLTTAYVTLYYRSKTRCTDWLLALLSSYYCIRDLILQVQDSLHRLVARAAAEATSARTRSNEAKELVANLFFPFFLKEKKSWRLRASDT